MERLMWPLIALFTALYVPCADQVSLLAVLFPGGYSCILPSTHLCAVFSLCSLLLCCVP